MSRLLLLNLEDRDVDILTRIAETDPRPEVLIYHENPQALIVRLGRLARLPVAGERPFPRAEDVVVTPGPEGRLPDWAGEWRSAGARFVPARDLPRGGLPALPPEPASPPAEAVRASAEPPAPPAGTGEPASIPAGFVRPPAPRTGRDPDPQSVATPPTRADAQIPTPRPSADDPPRRPVSPPPPPDLSRITMAGAPSGVPLDAFASPEATFRYLATRILGEGTPAALWWDGLEEGWHPWVWTGDAPPALAASDLELPTRWGRFRLSGEGAAALAGPALSRVAEDLALRDLDAWRSLDAEIRGWEPVGEGAPASSLRPWFDRLWQVLNPEAAFVWRAGAAWSLLAVRGGGARFEGMLELPAASARAFFPDGAGWTTWEPAPGLVALLRFDAGDHRAGLRLARLRRALAAEAPAR